MPNIPPRHTVPRPEGVPGDQSPGEPHGIRQNLVRCCPDVEFLDIPASCTFTSLSRRTLDYAKGRGDLPFIRCGAKILFRRADLIDWLERGRVDVRAEVARMAAGVPAGARKGG